MLLRFLATVLILLKLPLLFIASSLPMPFLDFTASASTGHSWNFGMGRPCFAIVMLGLLYSITWSALCRWLSLVSLLVIILSDSISEIDLANHVQCLERGLCDYTEGYNLVVLRLMYSGDLLSLVTEVWALVTLAYLGAALGCFHGRYAMRDLDRRRDGSKKETLRKVSFASASEVAGRTTASRRVLLPASSPG